MNSTRTFDVAILGAGGAGLMCALQAGFRGRRVAIIDHAAKVGGKILISGGGRCNFTNTGATPAQYVSDNPHFIKSAFSRYKPEDFIALVRKHGIAFHEKKLGQLFCDGSAKQIVEMLLKEVNDVCVEIFLSQSIQSVSRSETGFLVETNDCGFSSQSLVVATGGLSIPKLGATDLGYKIAQQFGLSISETAPALDGFVFSSVEKARFQGLSGVAIDVEIECNRKKFRENILFTHVGLSGPAALQASLHWFPGNLVEVNLVPQFKGTELAVWLFQKQRGKMELKNIVSELVPRSFAEKWVELNVVLEKPFREWTKRELEEFAGKLQKWVFVPAGTVGYSKAEVTRGGVSTEELSSKTMEAHKVPGLYFIGEVVDVTGWLGGYNFQWAWASGWAAGQVV